MTKDPDTVGDDFFSMRVPGVMDSYPLVQIAVPAASADAISRPIVITDTDGREAYVELVNGHLEAGGDLPMDEAAKIFLRTMGEMIRGAFEAERTLAAARWRGVPEGDTPS